MKMSLVGLIVIIAVAVVGMSLLPSVRERVVELVVPAPQRESGPGIVVNCGVSTEKTGLVGLSGLPPRSRPGVTHDGQTFETVVKFLGNAGETNVCDLVLDIARKAGLRAVREKRSRVIVYGASLDVVDPSAATLKMERF
jgi:hypothetical protein